MSTSQSGASDSPHPILVVDDESTVREFVTKLADELGYHAITAKNGADALELSISAGPFAAIITDLHMPRLDGFELGRIVRHTTGHLPIIYLVEGFDRPGFFYTRAELEQITPHILMKPVDRNELKKLLLEVLEPVRARSS